MATSFPNELDEFINPGSSDALNAPSHSQQHANANDAIEALQAVVGVIGSEDTESLTYKVSDLETQINNISNNTDTVSELLGLDGNNDLEIFGIENPTVIDTFSANTWSTVKYVIQVKSGSNVYASTITALHDGSDIMITESDIISNTNNSLFTYTFEENAGIIGLKVTPVSSSIEVRYYRTAVKA